MLREKSKWASFVKLSTITSRDQGKRKNKIEVVILVFQYFCKRIAGSNFRHNNAHNKFHMSHYTQLYFSGVNQELTWCPLSSAHLFSKWGCTKTWPQFCIILRVFFSENNFPAKAQFMSVVMSDVIHVSKAMPPRIDLSYPRTFLVHPVMRQKALRQNWNPHLALCYIYLDMYVVENPKMGWFCAHW